MKTTRLLLFVSLLSGCGVQFLPETLVSSLRILSLTSEPPEVAPGQTSTVSVLYGDPTRIGLPTTIIWVGCEPDPLDLGRSPCNDASYLVDPTLITNYPPGLKLLGFSKTANYASSPDLFSVLAPDDPIRLNGSIGPVIAIVIADEVSVTATGDELKAVFQRIKDKELPTQIALTRVVVSEKQQKNQNPTISSLTFDGAPLPEGAKLAVHAGQQVKLGVTVPDSAREAYVEYQPSGPVNKVETVVGAWYSSAGRFDTERFDVTDPTPTTFTAPGSSQFPEDPVPEKRSGQLWVVVRDNRSAQSYQQFRFFVCDESLMTPVVRSITPPATPTDTVVVDGDDMPDVLDVLIGDKALTTGTYVAGRGFSGFLPTDLPSGTYPVTMKGKNCSSVDTGLTYTVP